MIEALCGGPVETALCLPFQYGFMQRALVAGLLAAAATSVVGTWVVLRGLSFMGDALAHGVIPGIALGVLLGFNVGLGAALAALVMVTGINLIHRRSLVGEDTAIGLLFVGMLALGVVIISRTESYAGNLASILFGDALAVSRSDIQWLGLCTAVVVGVSVLLYRPFLALSFNEAKAEMLGYRPAVASVMMLGLIALAVIGSFQFVGTLLVFGLLIAPPAAASLLARKVPLMMMTATGIGGLSVMLGLLISYHIGTAAGATMAGTAVLLFFLVLAGRSVWSISR